jgi:hypothetical protein
MRGWLERDEAALLAELFEFSFAVTALAAASASAASQTHALRLLDRRRITSTLSQPG